MIAQRPVPTIDAAPLQLVFIQNPAATHFPCGVFMLTCAGQPVGTLSFVGIGPRQARIGYDILPDFRNLGHASRAVGALLASAPGFGFDLIRAECRSNNTPSRRILEKTGFVLQTATPFSANGSKRSVQFLVYHWLAPFAASRPEYESCVQ